MVKTNSLNYSNKLDNNSIAIIGVACRFPGANTLDKFWENLVEGVCSIRNHNGQNQNLLNGKTHSRIHSGGYIDNVDSFDAEFFGYSPAEASIIDPQQRIFLELCYTALEDAGYPRLGNYVSQSYSLSNNVIEPIGLFASATSNKYYIQAIKEGLFDTNKKDYSEIIAMGSTVDYMPTRVAYKLGFTGPTMAIQTACSSSLVSVTVACDSLLDFRCNMALAGGVSLYNLGVNGYIYQKNGIMSPDGFCRPFCDSASGTVFGNGCGVVVLRRLKDALEANDYIYAVIRGWAVNNDGSNKVGFSAPAVLGQVNVMSEAILSSGLEKEQISYIETHGTGTVVGDEMELLALKECFSETKKEIAIGSVKSNIGHLAAASGIAGMIKTIMSLKYKTMVGTVNVVQPSKLLDEGQLKLVTKTLDWEEVETRIGGVSSFGMGGTNAHLILEESIDSQFPNKKRKELSEGQKNNSGNELIVLSAKSLDELKILQGRLSDSLNKNNGKALCDIAQTLSTGRLEFPYRMTCFVDCKAKLTNVFAGAKRNTSKVSEAKTDVVVFMFPGAGDQYKGMARQYYSQYAEFRSSIDELASKFLLEGNLDIKEFMLSEENAPVGAEKLDLVKMIRGDMESSKNIETLTLHASLFAIEISLFRLLKYYGVNPDFVVGHSLGEYVAMVTAGIISLDDAIRLLVKRAELIDIVGPGAMLAVPMSGDEIRQLANNFQVDLAAVNTPRLTVVSGRQDSIRKLKNELALRGVIGKKIRVNRAFHSREMKLVRERLLRETSSLVISPPNTRFISCITRKIYDKYQVIDKQHFANHSISTVDFQGAIQTLKNQYNPLFVELGPGNTLISYVNEIFVDPITTATIPPYYSNHAENMISLEHIIAELWRKGAQVEWQKFCRSPKRARVPTVTYPFKKSRHWILNSVTGEYGLSVNSELNCQAAINDYDTTDPGGIGLEQLDEPGNLDLENSIKSNQFSQNKILIRSKLDSKFVQPSSDLERAILKIWKKLFGYSDLGVKDDFFSLGGHSLLALQFATKLWQDFQIEVSIELLNKYPTIRRLSKALKSERGIGKSDEKILFSETKDAKAFVGFGNIEDILTARLLSIFNLNNSVSVEKYILEEVEIIEKSADIIRVVEMFSGLRLYPSELKEIENVETLVNYVKSEVLRKQKLELVLKRQSRRPNSVNSSRVEGVAFILSSARSGSTLLRVMLQGHPKLFCPPELNLAIYENMEQRELFETSPDKNQGLSKTLSFICGCSAEKAIEKVTELTNKNVSVIDVYRLLLSKTLDQLMIDKSPVYSNSLLSLETLENKFKNAKYIYLARHPFSVIESLVRNRFEKLTSDPNQDPFEYAEYAWYRANRNIQRFLNKIPSSRQHFVRYEDLVSDSESAMQDICSFFELEYHENLLLPYSGNRMVDGLGDPNFYSHSKIEPSLANTWKRVAMSIEVDKSTVEVAKSLGYDSVDSKAAKVGICHLAGEDNTPENSHHKVFRYNGKCVNVKNVAFFIHALSGSLLPYREVISCLSENLSINGIAVEKLDKSRRNTFEEVAQSYLDLMREEQISGPYIILGWSMGGVLAFEMCCRLQQVTDEECILVMLDSVAPSQDTSEKEIEVDYGHLFRTISKSGIFNDNSILFENKLSGNKVELEKLPPVIQKYLRTKTELWKFHSEIVREYKPSKLFQGKVLLVQSSTLSTSNILMKNPNWKHKDDHYGWLQHISGDIYKVMVNGDHESILEGHSALSVSSEIQSFLGV